MAVFFRNWVRGREGQGGKARQHAASQKDPGPEMDRRVEPDGVNGIGRREGND